MALFSKVGIVGTGLIGGSLGLAIKQKKLADDIVGTSRRPGTLRNALAMGAINTGSRTVDILAGCDLVILATPVQTILDQMVRIKHVIPKNCIVIDVASTKEMVVHKANKTFSRFVGCHPLAGSQNCGIDFARPDMFKGALCVITPVATTDRRALLKIKKLWKALGSKVSILDPETHDKVLGFMSHLPHIMAFSLMACVPGKYLKYTPQSFFDITRISASSPDLWDDIFITNRKNLINAIDTFTLYLTRMRATLKKNDTKTLTRLMSAAQQKRLRLL
jgi:prephenate dehydrogenase